MKESSINTLFQKHLNKMDHTLMEAVHCIPGLPHQFWVEALSTATYLINWSPTKILSERLHLKLGLGRSLMGQS